MEELRLNQIDGNVKKVSSNVESDYKIPEHEQHLVHARIYTPQFNQATGKDESVKRVQTFYPNEFNQLVNTGGFTGAKVEVLHDPSKESKKEGTIDLTGAARPAVVSQPGAGTLLDTKIENVPENTVRAIYEDLYKGDAQKDLPIDDVYVAIKERINFLNDEKRISNLQQRSEGIEAAKSLPATATQGAQPTSQENASQGSGVNGATTATTGTNTAGTDAGASTGANAAGTGTKAGAGTGKPAAGAGTGKPAGDGK